MDDKKQKSAGGHTHENEGGRVFQEHGNVGENGKAKGHDLLNSDGFTSGVGSAVNTPAEARAIDEARQADDTEADDDIGNSDR